MYKSTGSQVGFDGARALERDPESCSRVMNGTFACDTASAAKHDFLFPHGWRVYLESPQPLSERWHPPPDVQFVTLAPNAGVEGEGDLDVAGEVDQFTIRTRARVVEAGKVFALYRTAGTSGTPDPSDPFLVLQARTVDAKTVFELFVDTGVDGCEVTLVTNASWTEPESVDLAVTYDDGAAAVYVDGSLDAMGSMPAECVSPTTKPTQWRLGDAGSGMAGDVNFLTVWSRTALAPWRVRRAALADYSHVPPPDHHFNFDEPPGTTEVTNSIDNGRRSSASLDPGCEIVGVHDGSLAQLDTSLAVLDADVHVHVPWTSKLAKVFQGSFSMQMWVKPGGDVEEDVELNIFGNYDVSDPEFGDCSCACDGKPVANGTINVTDDQGAMGVTSRQCAADGPQECGDMVTDGVIDACPGGVDFTAVWSYNQSYTGANFDDGDGDDGMLFGDCGCLCEGNETGVVNVTAFPGYLNGEGVPEAVCSVVGPGYCQMMSAFPAFPAFPACNVDFTTDWRPNNTYSGALYELGDCTCTCDGANMGVLDGCDSSTKAALNQSRVGCGLYPWECKDACLTIGTCESASSVDATHALVEAYSYGGGDWGGGGGGRKLLSQNPGDTYEPQPAALQSAEIVPDRRVTGRFVKLTQHSGDSMVVAELHVFRENFGSTLSIDADLALNKKVTGTEPVGRYVRLESTAELHFREVVVFDPTDTSVNLALNKPATSSPQNPGPSGELFPESMVDGDLATYFQTYGGGWFEVDLGEEMPIGGIHIANLCDGVMSDPGWCSDGNWDATMNNRALGLKVQILDGDKNVVIETASPTQSSRAYIFAWNYRQFGDVINLDTQDDSWKGSLNHQKLVDGDHSPAMLLAGPTIVDLGEETEIDGVFIVGDYDVVASKPKSLVTGSMAGFTCSVLNDGTLKCWGWNRHGQLGIGADGDATSRNTPTAVNLGAGRTAKVVSLGSAHTCAILDDDTLKCWGQGVHYGTGLLGYGDLTSRNAPEATAVVNLGAGRTAKAVAAGRHHTCAILDDGTLKCWGYNNWGQLGYGDRTSRNAPDATEVVNLGAGRTAKAVAAGDSFTCAILDDGTIKCWGMHQSGAVGDGTIPTAPPWDRLTPRAVDLGPGRTAKALSAGDGFACAILDDDTLKCWGVHQVSIHSEIDGTTGIAAYTPTAVNLGPGRTAKGVSGGNMHQCAILDDDTLKCRGYDGHGALGLGNRPNNRNTWVAVNLGDNYGRKAKAVTCGSQHTCAMLDDDTVKCWGTQQHGTLGYGDSIAYNPIQDRDAPEPTAVVPYIPHPDFTVEILDAERRSTLVTSAPMTSADGYLAEFNRAGVESIDWRYIIDSDVHSDSSYAWSDFVDQSYDWSRIKDDPGVYFKDDPGVYFGLRSPPCPENNRVENGLCAPCTNGGTRAAGDDPDAGDTSCAFPDRTALKAAVDSCLAVDATGVACCNHGANCGAAGPVEMPDWDVSMVTDMSSLFNGKRQFNADISRWDVSSVTTMQGMFYMADPFNQDIGTWDTSSVTTMGSMFHSTKNFNQDISMWDTSSVTDMQLMFYQASAFNQDLSRWDVSSVTTMGDMFQSAGAFNTMPVGWDTSKVTNSHNMFHSAAAWKARFTGGTDSTLPGGGWTRKENACDASVAPKHGGVGDCTDTLMSGQTCTPTCDEGYALSGETSCVDRVLTRAVCVQNVFPEDLGDCECLCCQGANCTVETQGFVPCYVTQAQCSWQGPAMCERAHNSTCNATNGTVVTEFGKHMPPPPSPPPSPGPAPESDPGGSTSPPSTATASATAVTIL
jgi:surface protein